MAFVPRVRRPCWARLECLDAALLRHTQEYDFLNTPFDDYYSIIIIILIPDFPCLTECYVPGTSGKNPLLTLEQLINIVLGITRIMLC